MNLFCSSNFLSLHPPPAKKKKRKKKDVSQKDVVYIDVQWNQTLSSVLVYLAQFKAFLLLWFFKIQIMYLNEHTVSELKVEKFHLENLKMTCFYVQQNASMECFDFVKAPHPPPFCQKYSSNLINFLEHFQYLWNCILGRINDGLTKTPLAVLSSYLW